jgi:DNA-directed RNA polymerase II subunit RPB2
MDNWNIVKAFVSQYGLVRHQIESYDDFLLNLIPAILNENDPLVINAISSEGKRQVHPFSNPLSIIIPVGTSMSEVRRHTFTFSNPLITPATLTEYDGSIVPLTPQMARLRNLTYQVSLFIQVHHDTYRESDNTLISSQCERVLLCNIPLMLKSELCILRNKSDEELYSFTECTNDEGGYFIIKGGERAIVAQEKMVNNFIYVINGKSNSISRVLAEAKIFSSAEGIHKSTSQIIGRWTNISKKSGLPVYVIRMQLPEFKKEIPLVVLFKAIGIIDEEQILKYCGVEYDYLRSTIEEGWMAISQQEALEWIAKKNGINASSSLTREEVVSNIILKHLFPHIGGANVEFLDNKAWFLGLFANRLINTVNKSREYDDRDHFGNKRVEVTGSLLSSLFKQSLHKMFNDFIENALRKLGQNKIFNLHTEINHATITSAIAYSFSTGNWGVSKQKISRTGVSQYLMRLSQIAMISHLRKFITPMGKEGKLAKPRQLHTSSWMRADPNETPEGEGCGLHKSFALLAHVSLQTRTNIIPIIVDTIIKDYNLPILPFNFNTAKLIVNGNWIGNLESGPQGATIIRQIRRDNIIPFDVGVVFSEIDNEIRVSTDGGRICRPVLVVRDRKILFTPEAFVEMNKETYPITWLIRNGYVEYIDASEEEELMIAMSIKDIEKYKDNYTHCEIDPSLMMGISPGLIPFSDHNPSPRVTYSAQFFKQAMGMYTTNYQHRMDTSAHVLFYPQKPIVSTKQASLVKFDDMPAGQMAVVALACYGGWNCEDSIIVNQSSVDRGMFRSITYKTYEDEEKKMTGNITEDFCMPDRSETIRYNETQGYHAIDPKDGLPMPGSKVQGGDIIVAKTHSMPTIYDQQGITKSMLNSLPTGNAKMAKRDVSMILKKTDKGVIDKVMVSNNDEVKHTIQEQANPARTLVRQRFVKVRVRSVRVPELGDKIALTSPQKGTIGLLLRQEDMPFTKDGIVPDVILNPSCLPSRMTTSQVLETVFGKTAALQGKSRVDGSVFGTNTEKAKEVSEQLKELGFEPYGNEVLCHGATGEMIKAKIFIGLNFYQRLKHLVIDKMHTRSTGRVIALVRQPTEGRSRDGGFRMGEMEVSALIAHGVSAFLRERLFYLSDYYSTYFCAKCGFFAVANFKKHSFKCNNCESDKLNKIDLPYACKLLFQELMAMGIVPRIGKKMPEMLV